MSNNNPPMYGNLVPINTQAHRTLRLKTDLNVLGRTAKLNSMFLAVLEFADACREYPIVFVRMGDPTKSDGKLVVAPLAVLGLKPEINTFVKGDQWDASYVPAYVRRFPFMMARIDEAQNMAMCYDASWEGFSVTDGTPLFDADGQPTEFLKGAKDFVENYEREVERTRAACDELVALNLLQDMRFEATTPSGEKLNVDGFLAVDEKKLAELDDATVVKLHRNGLLALLEMHRLSLRNMAKLVGRHA